jgi:predicted GNAT family N-acyltransferase
MIIEIGQVQNKKELEQILSLQKENLPGALTKKEIAKEGFVTIAHSLDLLDAMNEVCPHIIAKYEEKVIGYALCMHPKFGNEIDILKPMFKEISAVLSRDEKYIVMGQVCIDKAYRKMGLFQKLYKNMQDTIKPDFNCIITEVDALNKRSLNAHLAIGFMELKTYTSDGRKWHLIALK